MSIMINKDNSQHGHVNVFFENVGTTRHFTAIFENVNKHALLFDKWVFPVKILNLRYLTVWLERVTFSVK